VHKRGASGRPGLQQTTKRTGTLVDALIGGQTGRAGDCGRHFVRNRAPHTQKNEIKPWLKQQYCLPGEPSGEFVFHMEDVLEVYTRPYDARRPQVCLDETSVQLVSDKRTPLPMRPGQPMRYDYEYVRHGVSALFMLNEPLRGWREVVIADQRTAIDWRMWSNTWSTCITHRRRRSCW
jgi:hypothetical protein